MAGTEHCQKQNKEKDFSEHCQTQKNMDCRRWSGTEKISAVKLNVDAVDSTGD